MLCTPGGGREGGAPLGGSRSERSGAERSEAGLGTTKEVLGFIDFLDFKDFLGFPYSSIRIS